MKNLKKRILSLITAFAVAFAGVTMPVTWIVPGLAVPAMAQTGEPESTQSVVSSAYTVEFTYDGNQYVMPGDSSVRLRAILNEIGLTGEAVAVEISDTTLFSASNATGEWIVTAHRAFDTTEWMKVTINGVVYEIVVTDT